MEQSCHQCGAKVEQGVLFCPQCNAPQIRVAAPDAANLGPLPAGLPAADISRYRPFSPANQIQWPLALRAALIGGIVSAGLMVFPLGALGLGMLVGGGIAVALYSRRAGITVSLSMGARLGALSGVFGFIVFALLAATELFVRRDTGEVRAALLEMLQQSGSRASGPEAQEALNWLKSPAGFTFVIALGFALTFVFFVAISSLGGTIAAALRRRK